MDSSPSHPSSNKKAETVKIDDNTQLNEWNSVPVIVKAVEWHGLSKTKMDILDTSSVESSTTFGQLTRNISALNQRLAQLNIFKDTKFFIDKGEEDGDSVIVKCMVEERKFSARVGSEVDGRGIGVNASGNFWNVFGRAESLHINTSYGTQSTTPFSLSFLKPLSSQSSLKTFLGSCLGDFHCGGKNEVIFKNLNNSASVSFLRQVGVGTVHELKYSLDLRRIYNVHIGTCPSIQRDAGQSLKSSIKHTFTHATPFLSTKLCTELAGLGGGGSVNFLKNELALKFIRKISPNNCSVIGSLRIGSLFADRREKVSILDKFLMGGPLSIRGFPLNSLGPREHENSLGGAFKTEASLQLTFPLMKRDSPIHGHVFVNAGMLAAKPDLCTIKETPVNSSLGVGLCAVLSPDAKIELNISRPISRQSDASFVSGLQVGLGMEFL